MDPIIVPSSSLESLRRGDFRVQMRIAPSLRVEYRDGDLGHLQPTAAVRGPRFVLRGWLAAVLRPRRALETRNEIGAAQSLGHRAAVHFTGESQADPLHRAHRDERYGRGTIVSAAPLLARGGDCPHEDDACSRGV